MLAAKRSAGVAPNVNLKNILHPTKEARKQGIHSSFETQGRHQHDKSITIVSVAPQKDFCLPIVFNKKEKKKKFLSLL